MSFSCKSSFHGIIDEIPFISVDNFTKIDRDAYFLSHYHSDHYCGLYRNDLFKNIVTNGVFIYTSEITAAIISQSEPKMKDYVRGLKLGTNTITVRKNKIYKYDRDENDESENSEIMLVVLLPAGHCFGSVMFLFKIDDKNILYTGDFRVSRSTVEKYTHFHTKSGDPIVLEALYVDTTFQNIPSFPTREETVENTVIAIKKWLNDSDKHCVAIHTSAGYGYEFVFNEIYKYTGMKVGVDKWKWVVYSKFEEVLPGVTTDYEKTRIHLCSNKSEKQNHFECNVLQNTDNIFLYIHFSAMKWNSYEEDETFIRQYHNRMDVCFATHNSRSELLYFINYFSPKKIVGFPDEFKRSPVKVDTEKFILSPQKKRVCSNLNKKLGKKVDGKILKDMFS